MAWSMITQNYKYQQKVTTTEWKDYKKILIVCCMITQKRTYEQNATTKEQVSWLDTFVSSLASGDRVGTL